VITTAEAITKVLEIFQGHPVVLCYFFDMMIKSILHTDEAQLKMP
jgi:hypothetical protein